MADGDRPQPQDWQEWQSHLAERPNSSIQAYAYFFREFDRSEMHSPFYGTPFYEAASSLARAVLAGQGPAVEKVIEDMGTRALAITESDEPSLDDLASQNLGALGMLALEECGGWREPGEAIETPIRRLVAMAPGRDDTRRQSIWALLAYGRTEDVEAVLYENPAAEPPDPAASFTGNTFQIQLHLARCIHHGADQQTAEPAWKAFFDSFPVHINAEIASYPELIWAARAYRVEIGGAEPESVIDWLLTEMG